MKNNKIKILYEDKSIIVVSKPTHLLTISTNNEKEKTMFHRTFIYLKKKNHKLFIVHRLDRDTSGILVFAKTEKVKRILQNNWDKTKRYYMAVVEGVPDKKADTIKTYLKENNNLLSYSTNDKSGKLAITKYRLVDKNSKYSLLEIEILTGRKNQIRVHMKEINHPIVGDKKYKAHTNPINRLGLHAYKLTLKHPITGIEMTFEDKIPEEFVKLFGNI